MNYVFVIAEESRLGLSVHCTIVYHTLIDDICKTQNADTRIRRDCRDMWMTARCGISTFAYFVKTYVTYAVPKGLAGEIHICKRLKCFHLHIDGARVDGAWRSITLADIS